MSHRKILLKGFDSNKEQMVAIGNSSFAYKKEPGPSWQSSHQDFWGYSEWHELNAFKWHTSAGFQAYWSDFKNETVLKITKPQKSFLMPLYFSAWVTVIFNVHLE